MEKIIMFTIFLIISQHSVAQEMKPWFKSAIKSPTPNELSYFIELQKNCPFDLEKVQTVVDGVLIRSRIKPLREDIFVDKRVYLNMSISCVALENNNPVFSIMINFARIYPYPSIIYDKQFGISGIGGADYIIRTFKESVELAVTEHIKANFDL